MGAEQLSTCLWDEQAALEELAFRLEQELLVLKSGRHQWLARTTAEVAVALSRLGEIGNRRALIARALGEELGVTGEVTLRALSDACAGQDEGALAGHRQRLRDALGTVQSLADRIRAILARNITATNDALACMGSAPVSAYDASGTPSKSHDRALLVDARV